LLSTTFVLAGVLSGASSALADSSTIAGAPAIVVGQQEFGNTASVTPVSSDCYRAYWLLSVTAGDSVTIDWESQESGTSLDVFPPGTTDYNVDNTNPIEQQDLSSNDKNELQFQATSTATLPVSFRSGCGDPAGPYDFTTDIVHAMIVSLPPLAPSLAGTTTVGVHNPDGVSLSGAPIVVNLQVSGPGVPWTTIGSASPVAGEATISYTVPSALAGKTVRFQAVGSGSGYQADTSTVQTAKMPAAKPECVVPNLAGDQLAAVKESLKTAHCELGKVSHKKTRRGKRTRVVGQSPKAGTREPYGSKVGVTIGRA
jgi:hypothetical protein